MKIYYINNNKCKEITMKNYTNTMASAIGFMAALELIEVMCAGYGVVKGMEFMKIVPTNIDQSLLNFSSDFYLFVQGMIK